MNDLRDELTNWINESRDEMNSRKKLLICFILPYEKFSFSFSDEELKETIQKSLEINNVLNKIPGLKDRARKARMILDAWLGEDKEGYEDLFGPVWKRISSAERIMFTLTKEGSELRGWYGIPRSLTYDHVDSGGDGLLLDVRGTPQKIKKIFHIIVGVNARYEVQVSNGCKIYLPNYY